MHPLATSSGRSERVHLFSEKMMLPGVSGQTGFWIEARPFPSAMALRHLYQIALVLAWVCEIYVTPITKNPIHLALDECVLSERSVAHPGSLRLRGGGKGGCKAKHLSTAKEGRRIMVGKHTFPNLNLGSKWAQEQAKKQLVDTADEKDKNMVAGDSDEESDSVESYRCAVKLWSRFFADMLLCILFLTSCTA
jgi:hypothetical protein